MRELEILRALAAIPSVTENEGQKADFIEGNYKALGHEVFRLDNNVVARIRGKDSTRLFIESGHIDTVPPTAEWTRDPFSLHVDYEADEASCLGASDMQSGLALMGARAETMAKRRPPCDTLHIYTAQEETHQRGVDLVAWWLSDTLLNQYDVAEGVILEPTNGSYIGAGIRGDTAWSITAAGPGGHGSQKFMDPTALEKLARFTAGLWDLRQKWAELYADPLLEEPIINPTTSPDVHTDKQAPNVVPRVATQTYNLRVTPQLVADLDDIRRQLAKEYDVFIQQSGQPTPTLSDPTSAIYRAARAALPSVPFRMFPAATEQPFYEAQGIRVITFGPGDDEQMHEPDEKVRISAIRRSRLALSAIHKAFSKISLDQIAA